METERWEDAFQLLRGDPQATQRVLEAYAAWLVAQQRGDDAYKVLRYRSLAIHLCKKGCHQTSRLQSSSIMSTHAALIPM